MTMYINTETMEYPMYPGDVALNPDGPWAEVVETKPPSPEEAGPGKTIALGALPVLNNGVWTQVWNIIDIPVLEE